jgi:hypothetical protein
MPDEPTMTETQVKTKTVSKTAMAIAVAFLGFSAIAAAAATTTPQMAPSGNGAPKCTDTDVSTVNAGNMPLANYQYANINKKGTTTGLGGTNNQPMIGEDKCWNNTRILEYFCSVKNNKVSWNSFNCPTGTNCVNGECIVPLPVKTCDDAWNLPSQYQYFVLCKQNGLGGVCFNKYNLFFQTCTDAVGSGCITDNPSALQNMVCLTECVVSTSSPWSYENTNCSSTLQ